MTVGSRHRVLPSLSGRNIQRQDGCCWLGRHSCRARTHVFVDRHHGASARGCVLLMTCVTAAVVQVLCAQQQARSTGTDRLQAAPLLMSTSPCESNTCHCSLETETAPRVSVREHGQCALRKRSTKNRTPRFIVVPQTRRKACELLWQGSSQKSFAVEHCMITGRAPRKVHVAPVQGGTRRA